MSDLPVVPAKAGTHTPYPIGKKRSMGPGSRASALGRDDSYPASFNRSSASAILVLRPSASSRFSCSSSTTSSGARDEIRIVELGIDARDVRIRLLHFLGEPRALGGEIDNVLERQRRHLPAHHELHRAFRRGGRGRNVGHAREPLDEFSPAFGARLALGRGAGEHKWDRRRDVHLGANRTDRGDKIDYPADFGFGLVVGEALQAWPFVER